MSACEPFDMHIHLLVESPLSATPAPLSTVCNSQLHVSVGIKGAQILFD